MAEPHCRPDPERVRRALADIRDRDGRDLEGLCSAVLGLAQLVRREAEATGFVPPAMTGLIYVAELANDAAEKLVQELEAAAG